MKDAVRQMKVSFYDGAEDALFKFAVIISRHGDKWVFCKHRLRDSFEIPGGHREEGETILAAAERELREETGASNFTLTPVCAYSVTGKTPQNQSGAETYGMLYFAQIKEFERELHSEIEYIRLFDELPTEWTYPLIQPLMIEEYRRRALI